MDRRIIASALVVVILASVGMLSLYMANLGLEDSNVPPPESHPGKDRTVEIVGDLVLWAEAEFSQDFMPAIPPEGPPFYSFIRINITNNGASTVTNIMSQRATLYFNNTLDPLVTLNLTTAAEYFTPIEIAPGENVVIEFINDRSKIYSPTIEEGTGLYARILFVWNGLHSHIITTPPSSVFYTF